MQWFKRVAIAVLPVLLAACQSAPVADYAALLPASKPVPRDEWKGSIVHSGFSANPLVINGDSYEQCQFKLPETVRTIVLPKGTSVYRHGMSSVDLQVKKSLSWMGHPDTKTSIDDERSKMGVSIEMTGGKLQICPYGTWDSFEGGAYLNLIAGIPDGVKFRYDKGEATAPAEWVKLPLLPSMKSDYVRHQKTAVSATSRNADPASDAAGESASLDR
ncbi:hypothetical protein [Verrucomicrobium sp. BvORR034]|uniref:hypothetical protein n=1 Tax=Verrucomicrobium sp. BvORR034 TaxID=1396418 RepID=UPI000678EB68|nr:hypothetical protein [Verrucomicrobium sp. BvORR034]